MDALTVPAVRTFADIYADLDGKTVVLDGLSWVIKYTTGRAVYPYPHTYHDCNAWPTAETRETATYQEQRRALGDDYCIGLDSASGDALVVAMEQNGISF